jgi:hypothetical protein
MPSAAAATCSRWFFARGFFYPEDGGDMILRNVGSIDHIYTAPHPRRRHSSTYMKFKVRFRLAFETYVSSVLGAQTIKLFIFLPPYENNQIRETRNIEPIHSVLWALPSAPINHSKECCCIKYKRNIL